MARPIRVQLCLFTAVVGVAPPPAVIPLPARTVALPPVASQGLEAHAGFAAEPLPIKGVNARLAPRLRGQSTLMEASGTALGLPQNMPSTVEKQSSQLGLPRSDYGVADRQAFDATPFSTSAWTTSVSSFLLAAVAVAVLWWRRRRQAIAVHPNVLGMELVSSGLAPGQPKVAAAAFASEASVSADAVTVQPNAMKIFSCVAHAEPKGVACFASEAAIGAAPVGLWVRGKHWNRVRGKRRPLRRGTAMVRRADSDWAVGMKDPETGEQNYTNPWEESVDGDEQGEFTPNFHEYTGAVYKGVPVVDGLQFPLDPKMYYEPLEPPEPGAKWGDRRSADGNWYLDVDGDEKVQFWQGVGKRKTAVAVVRILKGTGQFLINGVEAMAFFKYNGIHWFKAAEPLCALSQKNNFDIIARCFAGGRSGQAGAIRMGLAMAMQEFNYNWKPMLKAAKYTYRDPRMREPKTTGEPRARKKTPWHKR